MHDIMTITQAKEWEEILTLFPQTNFLQSWAWGKFIQSTGAPVWRVAVCGRGRVVAAAQFYLEKARRGWYLACPGGPLFRHIDGHFVRLIDHIRTIGRQEKAWFFRCRPQLPHDPALEQSLHRTGFVPSVMHMSAERTQVLDLLPAPEELLAGMRKTTRQSIRRALANPDLKVEVSERTDDIDRLYELQLATQKRHHFVPFARDYLAKQFAAFRADNQVRIFKVSDRQELCAAAMIIFYRQEAVYHYAGSTRQAYVNGANYRLQWEVIRTACRMGMKRYNLWGVAPEGQTNHRFWGVTVFKRGFGGNLVEYIPAQDLPLHPGYRLTRWFEIWRKKARRL